MKLKPKSNLFFLLAGIIFAAGLPLAVLGQGTDVNSINRANPATSTDIVYSGGGLVNCGTNTDIYNREGNPDDTTHACTLYDLFSIFARVINFLMAVAGFFAIFQVIRSGQSMVFAMGNPESLTVAKKAMTSAVLGFALVLISYLIMYFVVYALLGIKDNPGNLFFHPIEYLRGAK